MRPLVAVTLGDPAGVGPEIILKALARSEVYGRCRPLVVGDARVLRRAAAWVGRPGLELDFVTRPADGRYQPGVLTLIDLANAAPEACPVGAVDAAAGRAAVEYVFRACDLALAREVDAVVTAPLNKAAMNLAGFPYSGHTELLAERTHAGKVSMLLVGPKLRVIHVSTHVSLEEALRRVTRQRVEEVIDLADRSCRALGVAAPRVAVAGLNPHAGEGGLFGDQEARAIVPAIEAARARGLNVSDPQPPDTVFLRAVKGEYDIVVAMYHDQGHIPMKLLAFDEGVNVTVGLPIIRTSVDHGTAFDIAGTGAAREDSLLAAIDIAIRMVQSGAFSAPAAAARSREAEAVGVALPYGGRTIVARVPRRNLVAVLSPRDAQVCGDAGAEIRRALAAPIGAAPLAEAARGARRVVIAADDMTRRTPMPLILPAMLDELNRAGVADEQVTVLVALGTHRPMTPAEIRDHFGAVATRRVTVVNNPWQDPAEMADLGTTSTGMPVEISRLALAADFLLGVGSIVPHHIAGYSGGAKIVQPGISGARTTGATHYFSTRAARTWLGEAENPVRAEMDEIAGRVGLKAIFNVVLDRAGRLVRAFYGDYREAHRAGVAVAREVYGVPLSAPADIVIANAHPCEIDFWQAHKALYPASIAVKAGGTIIVTASAPEGVAATHRGMLEFTRLDPDRIDGRIVDGTIRDVVSGALALAWSKVRQQANVSLVSDGIPADDARLLGFTPWASVEQALDAAFRRHGPDASLTVLTHAPETLPLLPRHAR